MSDASAQRRCAPVAFTAVALLASAASGASDAGRRFFNESVLPKMIENGCPACHNVGHVRPRITVYEEALPFLAMGDAPENSVLLYKIANLRSIAADRPTHVGGQRCASLEAEPCLTIRRWWSIEFERQRQGDPPSTGEVSR